MASELQYLQDTCNYLAVCIANSDQPNAYAAVARLIEERVQIQVTLPDDQPTTYVVPQPKVVPVRNFSDPEVQALAALLQQAKVPPDHAVDAATRCRTIEECQQFLIRKYNYPPPK